MKSNWFKKFAKIYTYVMAAGFSMFFVFDYLKKQEILAVLGVGLITSIVLTILINKKD